MPCSSFWFLGFGFWLAMSNEGWHVTQKFVILVPDPIGFAPWPVLLDPGVPCDICQHTSSPPLFAGLFVTPRNKDDMGDDVPTDQLSHNHCDCTDSHCNSHIVLPFVPSPIKSPSAAEAQRLRRDEEVLDAPKELWQPVAGVGGAQEEQGQERLRWKPVYHQASLRGRWRSRRSRAKKSRAKRGWCQCCGSWMKPWRLLPVRSSATLVQAKRRQHGWTCTYLPW